MENIKKILDLVQKTGEKCIVLPENGEPFVIMDLQTYESLIGSDLSSEAEDSDIEEVTNLTEEELLDKINHDVSTWRSVREETPSQEIMVQDSLEKAEGKGGEGSVKSDQFYVEK